MNPTHVSTINWRTSGAVGDLRAPHLEITNSLSRMDGAGYWGYSLWPIPEGQSWGSIDKRLWAKEFLQSAGKAERMSIELRRIEGDSAAHQYAVGRPGTSHDGEPDVDVTWADGKGIYVYPGEEYTAQQAALVYLAYYDTGDVPAGYVLRELDLDSA